MSISGADSGAKPSNTDRDERRARFTSGPLTSTIRERIAANRLAAMLTPISGNDVTRHRGYSTEGELVPARVTETSDGVDLNVIWQDHMTALSMVNEKRNTLANLLSYKTTESALAVAQSPDNGVKFEDASEFGIPQSYRVVQDYIRMGIGFKDYDLRSAYTWKFLRDASAQQVDAILAAGIAADNRLVTGSIFNRLFNPAPTVAEDTNLTVYGLYNGTDGMVPPAYLGKEFPANTNHYFSTHSTVLDSRDIEDGMKLLTDKGYGTKSSNSTLLIIANEATLEVMTDWRRGLPSRAPEAGETEAPTARYDFVLSAGAPAYLTDEQVIGKIAPESFNGLDVIGSYGPAMVVTNHLIPAGYVLVLATGGPNSDLNPVAFREHPAVNYQGLRTIAGNQNSYPLIDSFLSRSFGVGVARRGAAACIQVTTSPTYTAPIFSV
ncbi:hypothetical protein [Tsukamurella strandjordii]|uniref:Major capsid protein n=1 Tax=Tsukamurella strandjordii TaxID=147577 RepID=A0AA90SHG6_9ACTN|nr:hypothetical protein [Tsukamurella strandjordii]MDP0398754.1 hypothetical protein [Tsukamurella strandjordii]